MRIDRVMRTARVATGLLLASACVAARSSARSEELTAEADMVPAMVDVTDRKAPSEEEWEALNRDNQRGVFGDLSDFRSRTIAFMNTRYFTANPTDGTLASYGKMSSDKRYDRFGHIDGVQFAVEQNSWKQRYVVNAAALFQLAGSRFMEFAGVGVSAAVESKRQIEVTFIGTTVPKDEAIRNLNIDIEALEYLDAVQQQRAGYQQQGFKLFGGSAPPAPKIVLSNVMMLNGKFSTALDASVDGKLHSRVVGDAVELKAMQRNGEEITLLSPVVRCYRTYSIEFKKDRSLQPVRVELRDGLGRQHNVPQVFDLTPDI